MIKVIIFALAVILFSGVILWDARSDRIKRDKEEAHYQELLKQCEVELPPWRCEIELYRLKP